MPVLLTLFFSTLITVASIHIISLEFYLYWEYLWLDIPMHALGGVTAALGVAILPALGIRTFSKYPPLRTTLVAVLVIGVAWEVFEIWAGYSIREEGFVVDTMLDLVMDMLGALVGYGLVRMIKEL